MYSVQRRITRRCCNLFRGLGLANNLLDHTVLQELEFDKTLTDEVNGCCYHPRSRHRCHPRICAGPTATAVRWQLPATAVGLELPATACLEAPPQLPPHDVGWTHQQQGHYFDPALLLQGQRPPPKPAKRGLLPNDLHEAVRRDLRPGDGKLQR